jgi:Spy/CpxP family protein refolding chaperone
MTPSLRNIALGAAAVLLAVGAGEGMLVRAQDQNTNQPAHPSAGSPGRFGGPGWFGRPGGLGGPMDMLPILGRAINLTDAQTDRIKAIMDSHKDEWKALADREHDTRKALMAAVTADTMDEATIRQKSAEVAAVEADAAVARAHAHAEVAQILTPDQRAQLKSLLSEPRRRPRPPAQP